MLVSATNPILSSKKSASSCRSSIVLTRLELNGVPFVPGKVSDSQILMTAAKLVIASNPNTRIFRIARGESLGSKRMQEIIDIATKNGYQGFIENVVRGQEELRVEEYTEAK